MKVILCQAEPISQNLIFYRKKKGSDEQSDMQHCGPAHVSPIPSLSSVFGLVLHFSLCCQLCFTSTLKESLADVLIRIGICIGTWLCNLNVVLLTGNFVRSCQGETLKYCNKKCKKKLSPESNEVIQNAALLLRIVKSSVQYIEEIAVTNQSSRV